VRMVTSTLMIGVIVCGCYIPPSRPENVPEDAKWIGYIDGGYWARIAIGKDSTGIIMLYNEDSGRQATSVITRDSMKFRELESIWRHVIFIDGGRMEDKEGNMYWLTNI